MKIIVTGASGALGGALVAALVERGDRVAAFVHEPRFDHAAVTEVIVQNLGSPAEATAAATEAVDNLGGLDAVICVAGAFRYLPVAESTVGDWAMLHEANVATALNTVLAVLPSLPSGASITCIGAAAAAKAGAGMAAYSAAKSGIARLVESLAEELRDRDIRVNAVAPAIIDTPQNRRDMPGADPAEWTSVEAIADAILFLTTPAARAISGAVIPVTHKDRMPYS